MKSGKKLFLVKLAYRSKIVIETLFYVNMVIFVALKIFLNVKLPFWSIYVFCVICGIYFGYLIAYYAFKYIDYYVKDHKHKDYYKLKRELKR